ncbi:PII-like signaling protein [Mycolicibacterium iranicum]|uniref:PII-like signaling protein n=1 Tax=Mycolicibacterium iranicum TaxID=912594 RepID=A0A839Q6Q6_MYCIR|nr:DUF190 domain-containing protein [Mycolicibacterium iranicum]MBB2991649.1 PII-like signaling protein [Mycolicibacterium iranicum]
MNRDILTLTVYFAERQRSGDRFLADAVLDLFERHRIANTVLLRGIAGFGPTNVVRTDRSLSLSEDPPVAVVAVDTAERISQLAAEVATLTDRAVLALERGSLLPDDPGTLDGDVQLSLHVGRRHRVAGRPGYLAVCDALHRHGFLGAEAYLGVDGTAAGQRRRARFFGRNRDVPVLVAGIGTAAQALRAADEVRGLLPEAWFTLEPVTVHRNGGGHVAGTPADDGAFRRMAVRTWESSLHHGQPIHRALIARLRQSDRAGGATVLRAIWGFRTPGEPHGDRLLQLARQVPVTTVVLDTAERIAAVFPIVDELTSGEGLVTSSPLTGLLELYDGQRRGHLGPGGETGLSK